MVVSEPAQESVDDAYSLDTRELALASSKINTISPLASGIIADSSSSSRAPGYEMSLQLAPLSVDFHTPCAVDPPAPMNR